MELSSSNFNLFAAKYYDNPNCFNEDEFYADLRRLSTIKRMIAWSNIDEAKSQVKIDIRLLINNVILFYNVFEHHAASKMLEYKMEQQHYKKLNSLLYFLSLPMIHDKTYDIMFHRKIVSAFKEIQ